MTGPEELLLFFSPRTNPRLISVIYSLESLPSHLAPYCTGAPLGVSVFLSVVGEIKDAELYGHCHSYYHHCSGGRRWNEANTFIQYLYVQGGDIVSVIPPPFSFLHPFFFSYSQSYAHSLIYLFSNCPQACLSVSLDFKSCFVPHSVEVDFE